jgi:predicted MPP superfamily phosphohydrolase
MPAVDLLFNGLLALVDGVVVFFAARTRSRRVFRAGNVALLLAGALLAAVLHRDGFHLLRLYAFVLFLHLPMLLAVAALTLYPEHRRTAIVSALSACALLFVAVDAFLIEPRWLVVTRVRIESNKLERAITVAVVADLQTDTIGAYERRALQRVMRESPDLIVMTGDYIQEIDAGRRAARVVELRALLRELDFAAPLGAFAVRGNVEDNDWAALFEGLPVTPLEQSTTLDLEAVRLTGLDLWASFSGSTRIAPSDRFHIVFGHAPDFALGDVRADLLIAGHTHGGQVRLPFLGPLLTFSEVPRAWVQGTTRFEDGRALVVSRGIGMERTNAPRLRLFCRPEIVFIDCVPGAD